MRQVKIANPKRNAILAIYPHPKAIGFAIMDSPNSVQKSSCRYITAKARTSEYLKFISSLIKLYTPKYIIIEDEQSRSQHRLEPMQDIFNTIESMITTLDYPILHYSRNDIRKAFGEINKPEIAQKIIEVFPKFKDRLPKQRISTDGAESPAMSQFDALSLCITYFAHNQFKTP